VKKIDTENFDAHKARRDEHKSPLRTSILRNVSQTFFPSETTRYSNPLKEKFRAKRMAAESSYFIFLSFLASHYVFLSSVDGAAAIPAPKRPNVQMPDEYLPPNKILFLQNLPESVTKDQLISLFSQYAFVLSRSLIDLPFILLCLPLTRYPNLYEVRLIPTKRDIAFVEYLDEGSAGVAKDALHNYKLDGENKIKVLIFVAIRMSRANAFADHVRQEVASIFVFCVSQCNNILDYTICLFGSYQMSRLQQFHRPRGR
jgi:U2 small nuclear ribonucleoprotein B''